MEIVHPRCCGIDVHKASVVACLRIQESRRTRTEIRRFGTTTTELLQLHRWLTEASCTHVAIESTSIYWKPVFNVLEAPLRSCSPMRITSRPCLVARPT